MSVYKAINAVQAELAKMGISKDSTNTFDNYKFRGIDAVYNALSPLLAKHGLCILPRMLSRTCEERTSQKGGALFYVTVDAEFDFVCAEDGSKHVVKTYGEAMDRGDKATNKAMSAAYKYAAFLAFTIPTEGDNDADAQSHEVSPKKAEKNADKPITADLETIIAEVVATFHDTGAGEAMALLNTKNLPQADKRTVWDRLPAPMRNAFKNLSTHQGA